MREVVKVYKVYKFDELSDDAKEKAISDERDFYCDNDLFDDMYYALASRIGYDNIEVVPWKDKRITMQYDLSPSQGNGFSFDYDRLTDLKPVLDAIYQGLDAAEGECFRSLLHQGYYISSHHTWRYPFACLEDVQPSYQGDDMTDFECATLDKAVRIVGEWYLDVCSKLFRDGQDMIEDDERLANDIRANDYDFDESGKLFSC